ncbi:hypothetical protein ACKKBF_B11385 [Auxenochlorella protothecoides x Auxenochlorella symbiontica]
MAAATPAVTTPAHRQDPPFPVSPAPSPANPVTAPGNPWPAPAGPSPAPASPSLAPENFAPSPKEILAATSGQGAITPHKEGVATAY